MNDIILDSTILFDQLTDFAEKYGDVELAKVINNWRVLKLGETSEKGGENG